MAEKKVGPINIPITANAEGVKRGAGEAKKEIKSLTDAANKAAATKATPTVDAEKSTKGLKDFDAQIKKAIADLYKLKTDAGKGVDVKLSGTSLSKQLDKIVKNSIVSGPEEKKSLLQKVAGFSPGKTGGELIKKFTGAELVPESLMENPVVVGTSIGLAMAKAVAVSGVINRNAFERDKGDGRTATVGDQWTNTIESLPVVGGLLKGLKTDIMDAVSSVNQETELITKGAEAAIALEEKRKALKEANKAIERETAGIIAKGALELASIGDSTGKAGRSRQIDRNAQGANFDAGQKRDVGLAAIDKTRSEYNKDFNDKVREQKNIAAKSGDENLVKEAQSQIKMLYAQKKAFEAGLQDQKKDVNKQFDATVGITTAKADKLKAINEGLIPDLDGINSLSEQVSNTIKTMPVDDIDGLAKSFAQLHPDPTQVAAFNQQLVELKGQQDKIEGQKVWKQLTDDLKNYGLTADEVAKKKLIKGGATSAQADNLLYQARSSATIANGKEIVNSTSNGSAYQTDKENILSQLGLAGANKETIARVKLALDTKEAGDRYKAFKQQLEGIGIQLRVEAAGIDEKARRNAQIDAETDQKLKGVTDPKLIAEAKAQGETLKAKSQELADKQKANKFTDESDTKEKYQRTADDIADLFKKGLISEDTAKKQLYKNQQDYDGANMPKNNPELMDFNSGAFQRLLLSQSGTVTDSANPELAEAKKANDLLSDIKKGLSPKVATF